jgi:ElaB/YqjD/DUF883 family membrane-anchored ribosome-binding protein
MNDKTDDISAIKANLESGSEETQRAWEATSEATKNVSGTLKKEANKAFVAGKEYLGKAVESFGEAASGTYGTIRGQASEKAQAYRAKAESVLEDASTKAKNMQSETERYIRDNPLKSVGLAVGIGFLLAAIFRRH